MNVVFKIVANGVWRDACEAGSFTGSADDVRDGYIHMSTARQVAGTLARHFAGQKDLVIVAFDAQTLGRDLRYEVSRGGDLFPHFYAALPTARALWSRPIPTGPDGQPKCPEDWLE